MDVEQAGDPAHQRILVRMEFAVGENHLPQLLHHGQPFRGIEFRLENPCEPVPTHCIRGDSRGLVDEDLHLPGPETEVFFEYVADVLHLALVGVAVDQGRLDEDAGRSHAQLVIR